MPITTLHPSIHFINDDTLERSRWCEILKNAINLGVKLVGGLEMKLSPLVTQKSGVVIVVDNRF